MSLLAASKATGIARHYLSALEEGRYNALPGVVYGKSFVRVYGALLRLSVAPLLRAFVHEYTMTHVAQGKSINRQRTTMQRPRVVITPRAVRFALIGAVLAIFGFYFGGEILQFVRPPMLVVVMPLDETTTTASSILVQGEVEARAALMVNERVMNHTDGRFQAFVPLENGMNIIRVRAYRRHGKETVVERKVLRSDISSAVRLPNF